LLALAAPQGVEDDEVVAVVPLDLGALLAVDDVFEGELVELKLTPQQRDILVGRVLDVEPDDLAGVLEQVADRFEPGRLVEATLGVVHERPRDRHDVSVYRRRRRPYSPSSARATRYTPSM